jgi:tetratricopeptide (TPR) repeat protein
MRKLPVMILMSAALVFIVSGTLTASEIKGAYDPDKAFYRAKALYDGGDYVSSIEESEGLLAAGVRGGNVYYNLGNAYFKKGYLGKAILSYERAKRYIPIDSDLLANYRYAKSMMKRPDPPENRFWLFGQLDSAFDYLTMGQGVALAEFLYYLLILYVITTKVFGRFARHSTSIMISLAIVLVMVVVPLTNKAVGQAKGAIVTTLITDAKYEPYDDATVHFPLYEGMKIQVLRSKGQWSKIKRPDGQIGWVKKDAIGLIRE